jgi:hypothetical protein
MGIMHELVLEPARFLNALEPFVELFWGSDRGRQTYDRTRRQEQNLFPNSSALLLADRVNLVKDDIFESRGPHLGEWRR